MMSSLTRDGAAETVSRDKHSQVRCERGQGNVHFLCSAYHGQDWQPRPVDPHATTIPVCDGHGYILPVIHSQ